jgi:hypothetical protein
MKKLYEEQKKIITKKIFYLLILSFKGNRYMRCNFFFKVSSIGEVNEKLKINK